MPTVDFRGDDKPALDYIRKNGYASYSSIKLVRDCEAPNRFFSSPATEFGKELHSRLLENTILKKFPLEIEKQLDAMLLKLRSDIVVQRLLKGAKTETQFKQSLLGVMVLGYIDIDNKDIADLKTTSLKNKKTFIASMDFLQAALYLAIRKKKNFYYVGINKEPPYPLMIFNVQEYPDRLKEAQDELKRLLKYIKSKL